MSKIEKMSKATKQALKQIHQYEQQIKQSLNQDLNPIADLVEKLSNHREEEVPVIHALIYTLHRIFSSLIRQGRIHGTPSTSASSSSTGDNPEAVKLVKDWLKTQYSQFIECLLALLRRTSEEEGAQIELDSLTILLNLVRCESEVIGALKYSPNSHSHADLKYPAAGFQSSTFLKLVKALLIPSDHGQVPIAVRAEFILRYLNYCDDIRFRFLKDAR